MKTSASPSTLLTVLVLSSFLGAGAASARVTIVSPTGANYVPDLAGTDTDDHDLTIKLNALTYVAGADQAMKDALKAQFASWTFTYAAGGLAGTLNVNKYQAVVLATTRVAGCSTRPILGC